MELIECKGEAKFHSVTDMNHEQVCEVFDLDEQVDSNPSSNSLIMSKVTQWYNGAPIPTFIYTYETIRAICVKAFLPELIHISFLNEYDCMLDFPAEVDLHNIGVDLQANNAMVWLWCSDHLWGWLLRIGWLKLNRVGKNPTHLPVWILQGKFWNPYCLCPTNWTTYRKGYPKYCK